MLHAGLTHLAALTCRHSKHLDPMAIYCHHSWCDGKDVVSAPHSLTLVKVLLSILHIFSSPGLIGETEVNTTSQAVGVNQCHHWLIQSRQLLHNLAAGACYYGNGVTVNFQPPQQTAEPY
ncbi:hypothetical protein Q8A73_006428 [Channa argus]|nr:hypothetical protein Q8A73_006428 [Channa argus]